VSERLPERLLVARTRGVGLRLALPLALFTLHVGAGFLIGAVRCEQDHLTGTVLGMSAARALLLLLTLLALAAALVLAATAALEWRRLDPAEPEEDRLRLELFLAGGAAAAVALYLVWSLIAVSTVPVC
jgi:hypothetical protein